MLDGEPKVEGCPLAVGWRLVPFSLENDLQVDVF
jgi:hypothetical protein